MTRADLRSPLAAMLAARDRARQSGDGVLRGSASPAGTVAGTPPDLARLVGDLVAAGQLEASRLVLDGMARARVEAPVVDLDAVRAARRG